MTWFANFLIVIQIWGIGNKWRPAFLFGAAGEGIWTVCAAVNGQYDLAAICGLFVIMALFNYRKWGRDAKSNS